MMRPNGTILGFLLLLMIHVAALAEPNPLQALSTASGVPIQGPWDAAGSIAALQKMYQAMVVQLQELKTQSRFLSDVNQVAKESLRQYDAINNLSLGAIKKRLVEDRASLTQLDNLSGMNDRKKLETLSKELDRRIAAPVTSEKKRAVLRTQLGLLSALKRLQDLDAATQYNLEKSAGALSEREALQLTSQSVAILAKLQLLADKQRYQAFMASKNDLNAQRRLARPSSVYERIGGHDKLNRDPP